MKKYNCIFWWEKSGWNKHEKLPRRKILLGNESTFRLSFAKVYDLLSIEKSQQFQLHWYQH